MTNLSEIETAIERLPAADQQRLLLFLASRLRAQGDQLPQPRKFSREQIDA